MTTRLKLIALAFALTVTLIILVGRSPSPSTANMTPIQAEVGYTRSDAVEGVDVISADDGALKGVVPTVDFECSGVVTDHRRDHQDGFEYKVTLVFGKLAEPRVFAYLQDDGAMNHDFGEGFVLDTSYYRSHISAFYVRSASPNVKKAVRTLDVGDHVRLKGYFVTLITRNGVLETSSDPAEFRCKYVYLTQVDTEQATYY